MSYFCNNKEVKYSSQESEIEIEKRIEKSYCDYLIIRYMTTNTMVKLKKIGNSQAVIIPSSFLKGVNRTQEVMMEIENNEIRLVFSESKSLKDLIEEKRERNKKLFARVIKQVAKNDPQKFEKGYIIDGADEIID